MIERQYTPYRESYRSILTESAISCAQRLIMHFNEQPEGRVLNEIARCAAVCMFILKGEK